MIRSPRSCAILLPALVFLASCSAGFASPIVVIPGSLASTEAGSAESAPLGVDVQRFQQVFGIALLGDLNVGDVIVGLTFRLDAASGALPAQTIQNYEIRLSQSRNAPGSLSAIFADNRGADDVIVRSGPLVIHTGDFPSGGRPNPFGVMIQFTVPYVYQGGPLLLEVAHDGFPAGGRYADADYPTSLSAQTAFGAGFAATTADVGLYPEAMVVGFYENPEPSPAVLLGFGLAAVALLRWRKSLRAPVLALQRTAPRLRPAPPSLAAPARFR